MSEFFEKLAPGDKVVTNTSTRIPAQIDRIVDDVIEGVIVFGSQGGYRRREGYRACWDKEGNILPNRWGLGKEYSLTPQIY